jgi:hypothetical protein
MLHIADFFSALKYRFALALVVAVATAFVHADEPTKKTATLPTQAQRVALFDLLAQEIERLDGDGLIVRHTRPEPWNETIGRLRQAAIAATTPSDFGHVFFRLRATYPNSHSDVRLAETYRTSWMQSDARLPITIRAEVVSPDVTRPTLRVASVDEAWLKAQSPSVYPPRVGDIVVAMNNQPASEWLRENEIFCRLPLASQCPIAFHRNLVRGLLFWHPDAPLTVDLLRNGENFRTTITHIKPSASRSSSPPSSSPSSAVPSLCSDALLRVPEGFSLVWEGTMICVLENPRLIGMQIWRIPSFASLQARTYDAKPNQYPSVEQEVDSFYNDFWKTNASKVKHLIVDVAGNSGGESVVPWLRLLSKNPFQSAFVRFKKIREFDDPNLNKALFWNSKGALYQMVESFKQDGKFAKVREGDWLPPIPKFCPESTPCFNVMHLPKPHTFDGRISVVIDPFCNSACVNFSWGLKSKVSARIVGLPDTGDTTFSRLTIHFGFDSDGKALTSIEDESKIANRVGNFVVAATVSTDAIGNVLSAKPLIPDRVVERRWHHSGDEWAVKAISEALAP